MQAALYERTGPAREVIQLAERPEPTAQPGEVRVHLGWSGIDPSDVQSRLGLRSAGLPPQVSDETGACLGTPALTALRAMLTGDGVQG